ncbi:MAG: peptidoglycan DD-metalloendopeptidase family protein [Actinomycetes bacterium]
MRARRFGAAFAVLVLSATLVSSTPAGAEDPRDRKREVDQAAEALQADLHEHSREVAAAVKLLRGAESRLPAAREALRVAQAQVSQAAARDAAAGARLEVARSREQKTLDQLTDVRQELDGTRDLMGTIAREAYKRGGTMGELAVVMQAESPDDLANRVSAVDTVLESQDDAVRQLSDARAQLASKEASLEALREEVAALRRQTAERLAATEKAQRRAQAAEQEVSRLVDQRQQALAAAEAAKAEDARRYRQLQEESRRLQKLLAARAGAGATGASGDLLAPVNGPVTSPYGMREHPITGEYKLHDGTDFGVGCGVPVRAAASGTVVRAVALTGYGNQVALDHGSVKGVGLATSYNHLSGFAVSSGQRVGRGQVVGYVGSTGYSTGCHLHFMVYENGSTTNPMNWL